MTKEYIERGALLAEAEYDANFRLVIPAEKARKLPAADVVEVKHGRWEDGKCTVCAFDLRGLTDGENDLEQWVWDEGFPYCPNCGAIMDGGKENAVD